MSSMASTPPSRRVHMFINHSPETYEAKMNTQHGLPKKLPVETVQVAETRPRSGSKSSISSQSDTDSTDGVHPSHSQELRDDTRTPPSGNDLSPRHYSSQPSHESSHESSSHESSSHESSQSSSQSSSHRDSKDVPRKRRRTSPNELHILETEFSRNAKPCREDRERIASLTSMDEKAVQVWFQNKRQSCRRQLTQASNSIPTLVRTQSMPAFQNENTYEVGMPGIHSKPYGVPFGIKDENAPMRLPLMLQYQQQQHQQQQQQAKGSKGLKLSMSADGKAELVERSPLKQLHPNAANANLPRMAYPTTAAPYAARYATMPVLQDPASGIEEECASSLLVLKSGQWR